MLIELNNPLWVNTPLGSGQVILIESKGVHSNYTWTVILQKTGEIRHFLTTQITAQVNHTEEINLSNNLPIFPSDKLAN